MNFYNYQLTTVVSRCLNNLTTLISQFLGFSDHSTIARLLVKQKIIMISIVQLHHLMMMKLAKKPPEATT